MKFEVAMRMTLFSVKAKSSFLSRYPFSTDHFSVRNFSIASRPWKNWSRLRQIESGVYANCQKKWSAWPCSLVIFQLVPCAILEARVSKAALEPLDSTILFKTDLHFSRIPIKKVSKLICHTRHTERITLYSKHLGRP